MTAIAAGAFGKIVITPSTVCFSIVVLFGYPPPLAVPVPLFPLPSYCSWPVGPKASCLYTESH